MGLRKNIMAKHTVEKIGGTSMTMFGDVMKNVIIGSRKQEDLYNRIFVVSAYGGITNLLLEHKKTGDGGVYSKFAENDPTWKDALEAVKEEMFRLNRTFEDIGLDIEKADAFVDERIQGIKACLSDLIKIRSFGHFKENHYLPATREFLSALGEAHSAYNSTLILNANGIKTKFIDLTGWKESKSLPFNEMIINSFKGVEYDKELLIATGYTKCDEGIMSSFDRGYSEITFSKIAVLTEAYEGIIHKEFHLSTGDPKLMGVDKVKIIGHTNFDIADQLADMDMEAIHSQASKEMEIKDIPIRIKNTFDPDHPGTLISRNFVSKTSKIDIICGRNDILAVEVFDSCMVGQSGYDHDLLKYFTKYRISYITKNTNANTITHYVSEKSKNLNKCLEEMKEGLPGAKIKTKKVAVIAAMGTNMKIPGFLHRAAKSLSDVDINILAFDQCMRQVNMQFIVERDSFEKAQIALHRELVEK
jgi:aspartate kinase